MKKYHLHLDAVIVITLVVAASLGMNYVQYSIYKDLSAENIQLTKDNVIGDMNLSSCRSALDKRVSDDKQAAID
ncbi:MAG: hypothetical protein R3179_08195 [Sedimenticolaceae bacterium]|nr:hypothetical protein [Sedimenticolaceae bacterium]